MSRGASSMDATCFDEWEILPDHKSFFMDECSNVDGDVGAKDQLLLGANPVMVDMDHFTAASHRAPCGCVFDEEAKKPLLLPSEDVPVIEFEDNGVVQTELKREEAMSKVTEILISDAEEEEEVMKFPEGVKEVDQDEMLAKAAESDHLFTVEDEGVKNIGFSVGNLRIHGVGALCSFGVAAATFCVFLLGGKQQQTSHNHKIKLQMYADDQRIQRVMQQASRLNQTMSSVMGEASSARASISFGGHYHGF
ncbi:hypothetical protein PR202_gb10561 [Eleusine coracana subsp. coracana]|uniref:DUF6821 domain-containing protein n=1 Tax=Eleusine coracana subsp. coracana TaxID=191504 RepID=A0AAV5EL84_ELECO|nr:hypothetical protein QOZ80_3BG0256830 [Eleusine coracana subsp. coracana]GJN22951.1 hypothetical protein PR202_gb10561 [Eleusine coracana subsp. coracana]